MSDVLTTDALLKQARATVQLDDFGDESFIEGLEQLLGSIRAEAALTAVGIEMTRVDMLRLLTNRLLLQRDWAEHPEIAEEVVAPPFIVFGLPRSGTSKLQRMLAADPGMQRLEMWRFMHPARIPGADPHGPDPRIAMAEEGERLLQAHSPELWAAHPTPAHEVDEDEWLLELTFEHEVFEYFYRIPAFLDWVERRPLTEAFAYQRQVLQHLQWQDGGGRDRPWVLKSPPHLRRVGVLRETYPGAVLIRCHRDPAACIPSITRALEASRVMRSDEVDLHELGQEMLHSWSGQMNAHLAQETELGLAGEIIDVSYDDIKDDVEAVLGRIYAAAGREISAEVADRFRTWSQANPQYRTGAHEYSLERYGLTRTQVEDAFSGYIDRFLSN